MADDDVWNKTLAFKLIASPRYSEAVLHRGIELMDMLVCPGTGRRRRVFDQRYPSYLDAVLLTDAGDALARVRQVADNMAILGGKILMDEQPIHRPAARTVSAASLTKPKAPP